MQKKQSWQKGIARWGLLEFAVADVVASTSVGEYRALGGKTSVRVVGVCKPSAREALEKSGAKVFVEANKREKAFEVVFSVVVKVLAQCETQAAHKLGQLVYPIVSARFRL